jgi:hypothetical protein
MSNVKDIYGPGPCEAIVCQRELHGGDRTINSADDHIRVGDKNYHRGCAPPLEESGLP